MTDDSAPWHAHIYFTDNQRGVATELRNRLSADPAILYTGAMTDGPAGPHPIPQYEVHFRAADHASIVAQIEATGLRALVHPLTDDDMADHTSLAEWIGDPLDLDVSVLDPVGHNQGIPRFGKRDF